jgi:tetratricopeptide (TPR) repeat protein
MNNKKKNRTNVKEKSGNFSTQKKRAFIFITITFPIIFLIILEIILSLADYGGNLNLFIPSTEGYSNYMRCNPDVAKRYFFIQNTIPTPPKDLFLKNKPRDMYRIFVMGGSTTAGFPYGNNMMFSRILQKQLETLYPHQKFEIVNTALSAVNTYTLLDFIDEILDQKPDLIIIYAGHNEYYGALGVGSVESMGNQRWLIRSYLYLQKFRTFLLLRDSIAKIKFWINNGFGEGSKSDPTATLMERIVNKQKIPYKSELYEDGKLQFKENLESIINKAKQKKVKIMLGELVCNIRDEKPFISSNMGDEPSANNKFHKARISENNEKYAEARALYYQAKDLDELRFRAPEEFNDIIHQLGVEHKVTVVPIKQYFEAESPHGLIGNNLILEHLHPNKKGYYLMATAFLNTIIINKIIDQGQEEIVRPDFMNFNRTWGFTALDSLFADMTIHNLKNSWPFKPKGLPNFYLQNFKPKNIIEQIALRVLINPEFGLEMGHLELADYYEKNKNYIKAYKEYESLIYTIPFETDFYKKAATALLRIHNYNGAEQILQQSLRYRETYFAIKWLGQIALKNGDYHKAIEYLEKARQIQSNDTQLLYNLGRTYYYTGNKNLGDIILKQLLKLEPNSLYAKNLKNIAMSKH